MRVPDKYPAYISWTTFEQIQSMLHDNHAEYDRNKNPRHPRPGKALCMASSTVARVVTRWWCSTRGVPSTSVTTCGSSIASPSASMSQRTR